MFCAGCEDVHARAAVVGEGGARIGGGGGAHGQGLGQAREPGAAGVGGVVAGRHGVGHAVGDRAPQRRVEGRRREVADAHVRHRRLTRLMIAGDPVHGGDSGARGAIAAAVEHPHGDQLGLLGDAVGRAADRTRHVRPVPVAVVGRAAVDGVIAGHGAPAEVSVRGVDAAVDDVGRHARPVVGGAVGVVERQVALVDPVQAPGGRGRLARVRLHLAVLLDVGHRRVLGQLQRLRLAHLGRKALHRVQIAVLELGVVLAGERVDRLLRLALGQIVLVEDHDVVVGDGVGRILAADLTVGGRRRAGVSAGHQEPGGGEAGGAGEASAKG